MKGSSRAVVPRYKFGELSRLRALRRRGARYLLKTDINQFYPSVYTHSIPSSMHTKPVCKASLRLPGKGSGLPGFQIDKALQCTNDGQTVGVPIGPDSSLVVAETLLAAVDQELLTICPQAIHGYRYVDDFELAFPRLSDAEETLSTLQSILSSFELSLNPRKTNIIDLPQPLDGTWANELGRFTIRDAKSPAGQRNDIIALFSKAYEIAAMHREDSVIRYVIVKVQNEVVHPEAWRTFQNCILTAVSADPSAFASALGSLYRVATAGSHTVAKAPLSDIFESIIASHAPKSEGSEIAWALWGAISWSVPLSKQAAGLISKLEDDLVALLALDADARSLFPKGSLDKSIWTKAAAEPEALKSEHWLLAYEANRQKWLACPAVASQPEFAAMEAAGVAFYDPAQNSPQFPSAAEQIPGGKVFPNAILNSSRDFARLCRGEEFFAAWRAPIHLCILDYHRDLTRSEPQTAQQTLILNRPAHFNSATPAFAPAARSFLSSVASGSNSCLANSRYAASYAVN
jgi:hypothetical protein